MVYLMFTVCSIAAGQPAPAEECKDYSKPWVAQAEPCAGGGEAYLQEFTEVINDNWPGRTWRVTKHACVKE